MILKKPAMAGTLESSDVQITLRPNPNGGVQLNLRHRDGRAEKI